MPGEDDRATDPRRRGTPAAPQESPRREEPSSRPWGLLLVLAALALAWALGLHRHLSPEALAGAHAALEARVAAHPLLSALAYALVYAAVVAVSIPGGLALTLAGGLLFGPWLGAALAVLGATAGACLLFLAARSALAGPVARRAGPWLDRIRPGLERDGFFYLLSLRLLPVLPFWLVNLAPALVGMPLASYAAATFLGIIPATAVYAGIGAGLGEVLAAGGRPDLSVALSPQILVPLAGLAALSLAAAWWRARQRRREDATTTAAGGGT